MTHERSPRENDRDPGFYVGYLPVPPRIRAFLRGVAPALGAFGVLLGVVLSWEQSSPGQAVWHSEAAALEGVMEVDPTALLRVRRDDGALETVLLVEEGKFGARSRAAPLAGRLVRARGTLLGRDGRRLMELATGPDGLAAVPGADRTKEGGMSPPPRGPLGPATLRGEIVDSKCYFGAMKPGRGKTHKECATLCIAGGIPPVFVVDQDGGPPDYYLLADPEGGPANEFVLPFVGEFVEVRGELERRGDWIVLKSAAAGIRRL